MATASDTLEKKLLDHFFGVASYTPSNLFMALLNTAITDNQSGVGVAAVEPAYAAYARQPISSAFTTAATTSGDGLSYITSDANITFPTNVTGSENLSHWAILSGNAGDNTDRLMLHGPLDSTITVPVNTAPRIKSGNAIFNSD